MILITGGRGAVATHLVTLLRADGRSVRVASADPAGLDLPGDVLSVRLDLTDPATFRTALAGATSVFLYASAERIAEFVDEAVAAGVGHIVLLSSAAVLHPDAENNFVARSHLDVERVLLASPIPSTILRPGSFASNASAWAWSIRSGLPVSLPFPGSFIDPIHERDIAEAAHAVLTDLRHRCGQFTLTGPAAMTFQEQIDQLGEVIGRAIASKQVTREEWKQEVAEYIPAAYADPLLDWWESHDGRPVALTGTVEELTGHPARSFATWVADHAADYRREIVSVGVVAAGAAGGAQRASGGVVPDRTVVVRGGAAEPAHPVDVLLVLRGHRGLRAAAAA
jgi:uncharacterized protein YbjT (DUF2867 family)